MDRLSGSRHGQWPCQGSLGDPKCLTTDLRPAVHCVTTLRKHSLYGIPWFARLAHLRLPGRLPDITASAHRTAKPHRHDSPAGCPLNRHRTDTTGISIVDGIGVMLAYRAELAGHPSAGPQKLHAVTCTAFGADAFRRFFTKTHGLDTLNSHFGITVSLFCLHCHFSTLKFGVGRPMGPALADIQKKIEADKYVTAASR